MYRFNDVLLDTDRRELRRGDEVIALRPKVFDLLVYLVEHRDRIVPKQELFERIWPDVVVGDATLNTCIKTARQALGDSGQRQAVIQTRHGHGYRFIAEVLDSTVIEQASEEPPGNGPAAVEPGIPPLPQPGAFPSGKEHKQVTVLHCVIHQAAELASSVGEEGAGDVLDALMTRGLAIVEAFGGSVSQWLGDGFVALFGAPLAQEDHVRRAISAALEIERASARDPLLERRICLGLHTGPVVAGFRGTDHSLVFAAVGPTTERARSTAEQAGPGEILASTELHGLVSDEVNSQIVSPEPNGLVRVLGWTVQHSGVPRIGALSQSEFVGRDREVSLLQSRLESLRISGGAVISVVGEPGIGKSRLIEEFRRSLNPSAYRIYQTDCLPYAMNTAYLPVVNLLREFLGVPVDAAEADVEAMIGRVLTDLGIEDDISDRALRFLLSPNQGPGRAVASRDAIARFLPALWDLVRQVSLARPCVLVVENLHWVDPSSESVLSEFVAQLSSLQVLLIVTHRPGYRAPWLDNSTATQIALSRLSEAESRTMVASLIRVDERDGDEIVRLGQGNPFFLEELSQARSKGQRGTPDTVQAVLASRIDGLDGREKRLLQVASVIGTTFSGELLERVDDLDPAERKEFLSELHDAELIYTQRFTPTPEYAFKHALTRDVAYETMVTSRRKEIHKRIADVIQDRFPALAARQPELVGRHLAAAGDVRGAIDQFALAGRQSMARFADRETIANYRVATELLHELAGCPERDAEELEYLLAHAAAEENLNGQGTEAVRALYHLAAELDRSKADPRALFALTWGAWRYGIEGVDIDEVLDEAERLLDFARHSGDRTLILHAHHRAWGAARQAGYLDRVIDHARAGLEACEGMDFGALGDTFGGHSVVECAHGVLGISLALQGYIEQGRREVERAIEVAVTLEHAPSITDGLEKRIEFLVVTGQFDEIETYYELGRRQAELIPSPLLEMYSEHCLAMSRARQGEVDAMEALLSQVGRMRHRGYRHTREALFFAQTAEQLLEVGRQAEAEALMAEAIGELGVTGSNHWAAAEVLRLKSRVDRACGREPEARAALERAVNVADAQRANLFGARARGDLSRLLVAAGERERAMQLLDPWCAAHSFMSGTPEFSTLSGLLVETQQGGP